MSWDTVDMLHAAEDRIGLLTQAARRAIEAWDDWSHALDIEEAMTNLKAIIELPFCRCEGSEDCDEETCGCQCHANEEWSDEAGRWVVTYPLDEYAGGE